MHHNDTFPLPPPPCHADIGYGRSLAIDDCQAEEGDRVWYADVIMFFSVKVQGEEHDLAWVQWYAKYGAEKGRVHEDPNFPPALGRRFPRVFLPDDGDALKSEKEKQKRRQGRFDVIPLDSIIAPAPMCDDVSSKRYTWEFDPRGKPDSEQQRLSMIAKKEEKDGNRTLVPSYISTTHHCACEDITCTK